MAVPSASGAPCDPSVAFLDACVLYPPLVRGILLGAAEAGLIRPRWSGRVLDEWRLAVDRKGGAVAEIEAVIGRMGARFPEALVAADAALEAAVTLPDPADAHVLAGAVAAAAGVLVTFNLRDFPSRRLAGHGVTARHPDGYLWELLSAAPQAMGLAIRHAAAAAGAETTDEVRRALKRAGLPRLGKAWAALVGA